jgi:aryl-alcohol dehydrogenase-like predicted oxidoreductase
MRFRSLGQGQLQVSEIGFGAWGIGGDQGGPAAYGRTDDLVSFAAIRAALQCGINFFDTSDLYGGGHSESLLGQALAETRTQVKIASKAGFLNIKGEQDFSRQHFQEALCKTLHRLRTDYLDLYQLHSPDLTQPGLLEDLWSWLQKRRTEGQILALGISARTPAEALIAIDHFQPDAVQVNFNFADQRARALGLFELAQKRGTGLIIRTPLVFGFLAQDKSLQEALPSNDHRARFDAQQQESWRHSAMKFGTAFPAEHPATAAQKALAYCLSFPAVSCVIPGILTPDQAQENAAASAFAPLSPDLLQTLNFISEDHLLT